MSRRIRSVGRGVGEVTGSIHPGGSYSIRRIARWRRCELELFDSRGNVYAELRKHHDVQLMMLSADEAIPRDAIVPDDSTASGKPYLFHR